MAPFDGRNDFQDSKTRIECNLTKEKIHKAIFTKIDKYVDDEKLHDMNDSARATILLNLSSTVLRKVSHHRCAKDLWDDLNSLYTATSEESVYALQDQFMNYQMDASKDVDANMDEFNKLLQDLKLASDDTHEKYAAQILLGAIPELFSEGDLYAVQAESVPLPVVNVIQEDKTALWHARLGHMSNKGLSILHKNDLVKIKCLLFLSVNRVLWASIIKLLYLSLCLILGSIIFPVYLNPHHMLLQVRWKI
ncbi:hypothetical protein C2S51_007594 [Perilla frutescens var. frutescens]|nr:hypothetical protein C2S51_007594 [Perilla frutescens var. frutescens]